jgi:hypothetical protein
MQNLEDLQNLFAEISTECKVQEEKTWDSLDDYIKLDVFCYVCRKLYEGELIEKRSYRGMLYDVFGFDMDSYYRGINASFIELHNSIYAREDIIKLLGDFASKHNIQVEEEDIKNFLKGK